MLEISFFAFECRLAAKMELFSKSIKSLDAVLPALHKLFKNIIGRGLEPKYKGISADA